MWMLSARLRTAVAFLLIAGAFGGTRASAQPRDVGPNEMAVHYIDVDQGAAALLEFSCGAVLIDAGGRGATANNHLISYLRAFFERRRDLRNRLAAVFVTHPHIDHDMNLQRVGRTYGVDNFIYNGQTTPRVTGFLRRVRAANPRLGEQTVSSNHFRARPPRLTEEMIRRRGFTNGIIDPVDCPGTDPVITVLSGTQLTDPGWEDEFDNPNNHSLVIHVKFGDSSFLFTGDLETDGIEHLVTRYRGSPLIDVDVFAVGHHGAENGTTESFMREMTPEIAVISVGNPNTARVRFSAWDHGHPRRGMMELLDRFITRRRSPAVNIQVFDGQETLARDRREERAVYATSRDGDLVVRANASGTIAVATSR